MDNSYFLYGFSPKHYVILKGLEEARHGLIILKFKRPKQLEITYYHWILLLTPIYVFNIRLYYLRVNVSYNK